MTWYTDLPVIVTLSVLPPLLYLWWFTKAETYQPVERSDVVKAFLTGASLGVIGGAMLTLMIVIPFVILSDDPDGPAVMLMTAVIAAPIAEEAMKGACLLLFKSRLDRLASGLVLGVSVGLGFATVENLLYGITAAFEGLFMAILLVGVRSLTAAFAHASFTGILGYGVARSKRQRNDAIWLPFYILAVTLHAFFNLVASYSEIFDISTFLLVSSTIVLGAMTFILFFILRKRVVQLNDMERDEEEKLAIKEAQMIYLGGSNG
ncbi:MAG: PrsW family intramembrane metalloprotease [Methanomassiliicoccales archaeon]|nr:MAG: PrsW family intramembrane metalloprotease [Methanomassiliicoccales archaeon]